MKTVLFILLLLPVYLLKAQQVPAIEKTDTFFLAKKKGILGKLAQSISTSRLDDTVTLQKSNPYFRYAGKTIRNIRIVRLGFERDINDSTRISRSVGVIIANGLHKKAKATVIANNLFFNSGDKVNAYLMADNERHLREQPYMQDALIKIDTIPGPGNMADVTVIVKDVFSLGGDADISGGNRVKLELREENIGGTGSRLSLSTLFDGERKPRMGFGAEYIQRNVKGTFIDCAAGFRTFASAFNSGRSEENNYYINIEKPLVSAYLPWIGGMNLSINRTGNNYVSDSIYQRSVKYNYQSADAWIGFNVASRRRLLAAGGPRRLRYLISARGIYQHFNSIPSRAKDTFDYRYANINGVLGAFTIFTQNFTRTNFIYGFGRNEDVPEGFSVSITGGWINKKDSLQNKLRGRPYYALEGQRSHFNQRGFFTNYTLRIGGYRFRGSWEDVNLLLNVDHFTRIKKLAPEWLYRQFYSAGITRQILPALNQPLYLNSVFGLPYFNNGDIRADMRITAKTEAVFYNLRRFWGFRFAPFVFADATMIKLTNAPFRESELYAALGAGVRTRNENLIFGTIELKAFYFPHTVGDMPKFMVSVGTNIRFKYSNVFIRRPDFIAAN